MMHEAWPYAWRWALALSPLAIAGYGVIGGQPHWLLGVGIVCTAIHIALLWRRLIPRRFVDEARHG